VTTPATTWDTCIADLERQFQAQGEHLTRMDIALDAARADIRRLSYQLRTGRTPEQALAALGCSLCRGDGCQSPTCRGRA
jgi:hypothetical protein